MGHVVPTAVERKYCSLKTPFSWTSLSDGRVYSRLRDEEVVRSVNGANIRSMRPRLFSNLPRIVEGVEHDRVCLDAVPPSAPAVYCTKYTHESVVGIMMIVSVPLATLNSSCNSAGCPAHSQNYRTRSAFCRRHKTNMTTRDRFELTHRRSRNKRPAAIL